MISFQTRSIRLGEVWFDEELGEPCPDMLVVRHSARPPADGGSYSTKLSLMTDLAVTEEHLWRSINKSSRRGIRQAQKYGFRVSGAHPAGSRAEVSRFARFYNAFAAARGLGAIDGRYLEAARCAGRLWMSSVSDGCDELAWNTYVVTGSTVRSFYGASICHTTSATRRREIACAQRLLNWDDLCRFRAEGFRRYDWGGLFQNETDPSHKGINDFKREFGGEQIEYYEYVRALTPRGALYLSARPIVHSARRTWAALVNWKRNRIQGATTIGAAHATLLMAGYLYDP